MRSAALFEADNERRNTGRSGRRPDARRISQARSAIAPAREELIGEDPPTPGTEDGRTSGKKSWFLHDDRDREELDVGPVQRRAAVPHDDRSARPRRTDERPAGQSRDRALSGAPAEARPSRWEYVDPKGNIQGPFPASDLLKWSNGGFFSADQKVRRAGQQAFVPLKSVLPLLTREAEGRAPPPSAGAARRPIAAEVNGRAVREEAPMRRAVAHLDGRQREQRLDRPARGTGYQGQHPADALLSAEESAVRARNAHAATESEGYAPREARGGRGGRHGFEPAGRGGRRDDTGNQGFRERGRGGGRGDGYGRGGRGQGAAPARAVAVSDAAEPRLPYNYKIAQKLFTAEAELATDEPMWRYIDPSGTVQGPFPAKNMLEWYRKGMLHDMGLQVCGAERKVAPPDVPLPIHYYKLGDLLESVKRGERFTAVTVSDIRSGTARPLLSAKAPAHDAQPSSGAKRTDATKAGKRKGGSAPPPPKAALDTVKVKLTPVESDDGVTVQLIVVPAAPKPQEATAAKEAPASAAAAAAPAAADHSSNGAVPAAGMAAVATAPAAAALPDTLLPEITDIAAESPADTAEAGAGDGAAVPTVEAEPKAAPDAVSKAAADASAVEGVAKVESAEEPVVPKAETALQAPELEGEVVADTTGYSPAVAAEEAAPEAAEKPPATKSEEAASEAPGDSPAMAAKEETLPATAADEKASAAEAVPAEAEETKDAASVAAAEPLEGAGAEPPPEESAVPEEAKVEEVQAVLASNVSAVVAADTETADSITEGLPAAAQHSSKEVVSKEDPPATDESPAHGAGTAVAEESPAPPQDAVSSTPAQEVNGSSGAAPAAEAAKPAKEEKMEAEETPPVEVKPPPSTVEDGNKSETLEVAAGAKEGTAEMEAAKEAAEAEKPKQSSMFKSALKMFQGK